MFYYSLYFLEIKKPSKSVASNILGCTIFRTGAGAGAEDSEGVSLRSVRSDREHGRGCPRPEPADPSAR